MHRVTELMGINRQGHDPPGSLTKDEERTLFLHHPVTTLHNVISWKLVFSTSASQSHSSCCVESGAQLVALPTYCSLSAGPAQNFFTGPLLFSQGLRYDWIHIQTDAKNKITLDSTATYHVLNFKCAK